MEIDTDPVLARFEPGRVAEEEEDAKWMMTAASIEIAEDIVEGIEALVATKLPAAMLSTLLLEAMVTITLTFRVVPPPIIAIIPPLSQLILDATVESDTQRVDSAEVIPRILAATEDCPIPEEEDDPDAPPPTPNPRPIKDTRTDPVDGEFNLVKLLTVEKSAEIALVRVERAATPPERTTS